MQVNPYLMFNGQCEAAFKFYHQVLGGELGDMMTFAGSPRRGRGPPRICPQNHAHPADPRRLGNHGV